MKTYLVYKERVEGFKDVSETVKVVEKISASSVHSLKKETASLSIYINEIKNILFRLSPFCKENNHPLLQKNDTGEKTLVIITGDKGLVGGLWHKVIDAFLENDNHYQSVIIIGKEGQEYLNEENVRIVKSFTDDANVSLEERTMQITDYVFREFENKIFSRVDILYPRFISLTEQRPGFIPFLPFELAPRSLKDKSANTGAGGMGLPIFEPARKYVLSQLLKKYINLYFHGIIVETRLSESLSRTLAMEHASAKTDALIKRITHDYMKERRRFITQKQLESFIGHKIR